jgi:phosphatidylglycerol lysyltransferase
VLVLGIFSFLTKKENILFRVTPAISIFILGLVNIISAITPTLPGRLSLLRKWIPIEAIQASGWFVLFSGIAMLMLAVFLFRGIKSAWKIAIFLAAVSLFANLAKGIDWEEAIVTTIVLIFLLISRDQYISKKVTPIRKVFWFPSIISFLFVLVFGTFGFYSLDLKHFNIDFTFWESFKETITAFFLMNVDLKPGTTFGKTFLFSIHIMGLLTMILWVYQALKPYISRGSSLREEEVLLAKSLLTKYGNSSLDYFKTYKDKSFWFNADKSSFVSYKTSLDFAFVLENPVAINESVLKTTILDFDKFCENNGLKPVYYRIPEISLDIYKQMDKIFLPIGEEGVIDLKCFSTNGSDKKATRNAVNKLSKSGFLFKAYEPPLKDGFIQQIKAVSDEWLFEMKHKELVFAQGIFDENELKTQPVFTVENPEGRIEAFVNLIPNFSPGEANFDLMRKTNSAPNGTMDFLFVKMFEQMKLMGYSYCNIGLVPMSGIQQPHSIGESSMKLAYEKLKSFSQYRSLYQFKEKFDPSWRMTYLVYDEAFDLIFIPRALKNLMRNK